MFMEHLGQIPAEIVVGNSSPDVVVDSGSIPLAETRKKTNQPGLGTFKDATLYLLLSTSGQLARRICSDSDTANSGHVGLDESG